MSNPERKGADVQAPRASIPPDSISVSGAAGQQATPEAWKNRFVRFFADGARVYIHFSAASTPAVTTATGWPIPDGTFQDFYVKGGTEEAFIHHIASGAGTLRCLVSSPE